MGTRHVRKTELVSISHAYANTEDDSKATEEELSLDDPHAQERTTDMFCTCAIGHTGLVGGPALYLFNLLTLV